MRIFNFYILVFTVLIIKVELKATEFDTINAQNIYNNVEVLMKKGAFPDALVEANTALKIYKDHFGEKHDKIAKVYKILGMISSRMGQTKDAINYFHKVVDTHSSIDPHHPKLSSDLNNLALGYTLEANYRMAIKILKEAISIRAKEDGFHHEKMNGLYINIGNCFQQLGDYDNAFLFYRKAFTTTVNQNSKVDYRLNYNNFLLGIIYFELGDIGKAKIKYQETLDIRLQHFREMHPQLLNLYNNLGLCFQEEGNYTEALKYFEKCIKISEENFKGHDLDFYKYVHNKAQCLKYLGKYDLAKSFFEQALTISKKQNGLHHSETARCYQFLGSLYQYKGDLDQALDHYQSAIQILMGDNSISDLNSLEQVQDMKVLLLTVYAQAETFNQKYAFQSDITTLMSAEEYYAAAIQIMDHIRYGYRHKGAKKKLLENNFKVYEGAIQNQYLLWKETKNNEYIKKAFSFSEKSKSLLLLEAFNEAKAEQFSDIPDKLLERETQLKLTLTSLEKQIFFEKNKDSLNMDAIHSLKNELFESKLSYDSLINQFEKEFPRYFNLKYSEHSITINHVQKDMLNENQTVIEYFLGEHHIYLFVITKNQYQLYQIEKEFPLNEWIDGFRQSIAQYHQSFHQRDSLNEIYTDYGYRLYEKLIQPIESKLTDQLIIIPDGILGYLPFGALLKEKPINNYKFRTHHYLINDYQISYAYSAAFLEEMLAMPNSNAKKSLLGVAPYFESEKFVINEERVDLTPLKFNVQEVKSLNTLIGGNMLINDLATVEHFVNEAEEYQLIHFATHGKANDDANEYSYLAFTANNDSLDNEFLYLKDLYNLNLKSDMVVLSACETGLGELQKGEGILSLARGFSYAGAKSIVTTLWQISDASTPKLMQTFYKYVKQGVRKDKALQMAKIDFLKNNKDQLAHPYYWSAFIPIGDMVAVSIKDDNRFFWTCTMVGLSLIGFMLYFKLRVNKSEIS